MLNYIGYDISLASNNKNFFNQLIINYCNRFSHNNSNNLISNKIFDMIELHFLNILLTKSKK